MLKLVLLVVSICCVLGSNNNEKKIQKTLNDWNWDVKCWGVQNVIQQREFERSIGEKCNQMPMEKAPSTSSFHQSVVSLPINYILSSGAVPYMWKNRGSSFGYHGLSHGYTGSSYVYHGRRQAVGNGINVAGFQEDIANKISNMTCVLKTLTVIGSDLKINRPLFESEFFKTLDLSATDNLNDPLWRKKMSALWVDCINLSESIPQSSLDIDPSMRKFGQLARVAIFNKCNKEAKKKMCGAAQIQQLITTYPDSEVDTAGLGLALDKYDKATLTVTILQESATPNEMFQEEFFHGD